MSSARTVAGVFVGSRLVLVIVALVVVQTGGLAWAKVLSGWDVQHFFAIASDGYANPLDVAFFPGLPALLRGLNLIGVPMVWGGVALSMIGSALAAGALYRLGGPVAAALWLLAPMTVFTFVPYTEALFCAAAFWAWERARGGRWTHAAFLAALAATFRISVVFLIAALLVLALTQHDRNFKARLRNAGWLILPALVLVGYAFYLWRLTGSWTAWLSAQSAGWHREFTDPISAFQHTWEAAQPAYWPDRPLVATVFAAEIVVVAIGLLATVSCLVKRYWAEAAWVGLQVAAFATSYWYMSANRALLLWFPVFVGLAAVLSRRPAAGAPRMAWRMLLVVVLLADLAAMIGWAWLFFTGQWAG